jgi:flagellar motor switch protein FliG
MSTSSLEGRLRGGSAAFTEGAELAPPDAEPASRRDTPPLRKAAILVVSLEESLARQLLARLDRSDVDAVSLEIARLDQIDPEEQRRVLQEFYRDGLRRLRFVFEDVVRLADVDLRRAYLAEHAGRWALALAGASRPARLRVLGALSGSPAETLRRALEALGPIRLDEVEAAQAEVAEHLRRLHDDGRIALPEPEGQEEILV